MPIADNCAQSGVMKAQTIRQAKEAFKSRDPTILSERDRKVLDRSLQLDRRAWATREREKRRVESVQKRAEKERQEKCRQAAQLGSQRRTDRFGHIGSQFHLGAFFTRGMQNDQHDLKVIEDDPYEELDDQTLLEALEMQGHVESPLIVEPNQSKPSSIQIDDHTRLSEDIIRSAFWDELESGTQIARQINGDDSPSKDESKLSEHKNASQPSSLEYGEWDLTVEELNKLEATAKWNETPALMPPPTLPVKAGLRVHPLESRASGKQDSKSAVSQHSKLLSSDRQSSSRSKNQVNGPTLIPQLPTSPSTLGFTMTELESFVDDDLQLTQISIG